MASLIDAKCAIPLFNLNDTSDYKGADVASSCGRLNGYLSMSIVGLCILGFGIMAWYNSDKMVDATGKPIIDVKTGIHAIDPAGKKHSYLIMTIVCTLFVWFVVPMLMGWLASRSWFGYDSTKKAYMSQGFTEVQAIGKMQDMEQSRMQADATREGLFSVASALSTRKR